MKLLPQNTRRNRSLWIALAGLLALPSLAHAATITVCASGCSYPNASLQAAINAAAAGDTVLLEEGFTYVGDFTFPVKAGAGAGAITTIRTGVSSTGVVQNVNRYPAANVRICPSGFVVDWYDCATRAPQDMTRIAKLSPLNNNAPALTNVDTATGATPVSYYTFQWLEFVANAYGGSGLIVISNDSITPATGSSADMPNNLIFDQVVIRGLPYSGQFRGLTADAKTFTLRNSHISDIKAIGEGQALWFNGGGPFTITNNYVNGGAETFFTGGAGTLPEPELTVAASPAPTTTAVGVTGTQTDLYVGKNFNIFAPDVTVTGITAASDAVVTTSTAHGYVVGWEVDFNGTDGCLSGGDGNINSQTAYPRVVSIQSATQFTVEHNCSTVSTVGTVRARFQEEITGIAGAVLTFSPALPVAPLAGAILYTGMVINGITARYNVFTHPQDWFTTPRIVPLPTGSAATAFTTGGALPAGTYGYRVLARWKTAQDNWADSGAAAEVSATVSTGNTGRVTVTWNAVANAQEYLVYARAPGAQTRWFTTGTATTFTDTGSDVGSTVASVDTSPTRWQLKNVFELKQGINVTVQYNIIEQSWSQAQSGPCVLFTGSQQNNDNWSAVVRDVDFSYNEVRHCNQSGQISGTDALPNESARSGRINIHHNLFWDIGGDYGGASANWMYTVGGSPRQWPNRSAFDVTFNHNTFAMDTANDYQHALYFATCSRDMSPMAESSTPNFLLTNNIFYSGTYGIPSEDPAQTCGMVQGRLGSTVLGAGSAFNYNVIAGASNCSIYTDDGTNITCPSIADLEALTFTGPILTNRQNYAVKATSPYFGTASDATNYGADIATLNTAMVITESGNNSGGGGGAPLTVATSSPLPTGVTTQPYSQTLSATGGTAPYTWILTNGTMPAGLAFTPATGLLSGTPTTATTNRALTFQVTDAAAQQVSKVLYLTVIRYSVRASRYNWNEMATFVRGVAPSNPTDQVRIGDLWYDSGTSTLKKATDLGPPIIWDPTGNADLSNLNATSLTSGTVAIGRLGLSGTPSSTTYLRGDNTWQTVSGATNRPQTYILAGGTANFSWTLAIGGGNQYSSSQDIFADLTGMTECRLFTRTNVTLNSIMWIKYSTNDDVTTLDLGTTADTPQVDLDTTPLTNFVVGAWAPIATGAKGWVRLGLWGKTTEATGQANTAIRNTGLVCR